MAFNRSAIKDKALLVNGKAKLVKNMTDAEIRTAFKNAKNRTALAPGWTYQNGKVVKSAAKPSAPSTPAAQAPKEDKSLTAYLTDPIYQRERADMDYEKSQAQADYQEAMGINGAPGSIFQDWDYAIKALTRGNRRNISDTNAALGSSNLAGSGIARKSLSDIAGEFFADQTKLNTMKTRDETTANRMWQGVQDRYNAANLAAQRQAADRWTLRNPGAHEPVAQKKATAPPGMTYTKDPKRPGKFTLTPTKKKPFKNDKYLGMGATKQQKKATAPPGMKYVKNPSTGKYKLQRV